jgi:glycosyltransferase involved in cell wall biosynthesis
MSRILFVELNEDGTVGGSHCIQADLITRLPAEYVPVVLHYQDNSWADRLRGLGVEVHVWDHVREEERAAIAEGGKVSTGRAMLRLIRTRARFIEEHGIDMVHLNNSPFQGLDDWLPAARLAGVPCVTYAMGDARREPNPLRRWGMARFDRIFSLSRLVSDSLVDNGVPAERIVLTYPGLDLEGLDAREPRPRDDVRAEFGVQDGQVLAVMVGNVRQWKGQHVIVEAVGALDPAHRAQLFVLLVGDISEMHRPYADGLEARMVELGIDDRVRFIGRREDVPDLLEAADIALHASTIPEPFGLVVLEAMVHGCAVVAGNAGGPIEMLSADTGLLHNHEDPAQMTAHLERLLDDPSLRERLARGARDRARSFDIREHVRLITDAYRRLLP